MESHVGKSLFLAPHNDDECLFGAYIIQIYKPLVVVITDSYIQYERGELLSLWTARRLESCGAIDILDPTLDIEFCGVPDKDIAYDIPQSVPIVEKTLEQFVGKFDLVFAPALEGGHHAHDIIGVAAAKMFSNVKRYSTYTKHRYYPEGNVLVPATEEMKAKKLAALKCYKSQWANCCRPYFTEPRKDEYFCE